MDITVGVREILLQVTKSKYSKFFINLDDQISRNLKSAGIETRPEKSNGLWCSILLPAVLSMYSVLYPVSTLYKVVAFISVGNFCYSLLFIVFTSISAIVKETYGGCFASSLVSSLLIYGFLGQDLTFSIACSLSTVYVYSVMLRESLMAHPKTFTVGEAMVVTQGISLFAITMLLNAFTGLSDVDEEMRFVNIIVNTVLSTVGLIVTALYSISDDSRDVKALVEIVGAAAIFALLLLHLVFGIKFIPKAVYFFIMRKSRLPLFAFWLGLTAITAAVLTSRAMAAVKATTVTRKIFHILAALVFASGILIDVPFICLAAGAALGVIFLIEALRKSNIKGVSSPLQAAFDVYSDEKDCGSFAVTPLYMYAGLAGPLALAPRAAAALDPLAGVLATGIGDSAASCFGTHFGRTKWQGTNKTVEGTVFNIVSQVAIVYLLQRMGCLHANNALFRTAIAAAASSLVEAHTDQVDNLILPLISLLAFQATWLFR